MRAWVCRARGELGEKYESEGRPSQLLLQLIYKWAFGLWQPPITTCFATRAELLARFATPQPHSAQQDLSGQVVFESPLREHR
jgi:hypothetical protein